MIFSTSWLEMEQLLVLSLSTSGLMGSLEGERQEDSSNELSVVLLLLLVVVASDTVVEVVVSGTEVV